ncbi:DUF7847 domain-containing protein [Mycolicibacterium mengxianglii]|uniref:DUF7847 domain-containing protein n=1 Tax=Mycolicibacterium mengxianglii TaxID=2736649 RepID=UPI0018D16CB7
MTQPPNGPGWPPPAYPPPGYPAQGFPPPGYPQGYPPPGYAPPGYPPPGYSQQGYPPPGYPVLPPMAMQPGIIPLRPLALGDIFNGAVRYVRANPKASLGLTAVVVIITEVLGLILQVGPLAAMGELPALRGESESTSGMVGSVATGVVAALMQALAAVVLSGMLTVVVGRAVFGSPITIGEAWAKIRDRILPLLGLALLELLGAVVLFGLVILVIVGLAVGTNAAATVIIGVPLGLVAFLAVVYLATVLSFAPVAVVLERMPVIASIKRSFFLVRHDLLRVFGIRALAGIVVWAVSAAVAVPFALGQVIAGGDSTAAILFGTISASVGAIIGQVITAPFTAGVVVLLYTDRRMRAEAFDLVLRTGATAGPGPTNSTDNLWLVRR